LSGLGSPSNQLPPPDPLDGPSPPTLYGDILKLSIKII